MCGYMQCIHRSWSPTASEPPPLGPLCLCVLPSQDTSEFWPKGQASPRPGVGFGRTPVPSSLRTESRHGCLWVQGKERLLGNKLILVPRTRHPTLHEGVSRGQSEALLGSVPHCLTPSIPPRQGDAGLPNWHSSLSLWLRPETVPVDSPSSLFCGSWSGRGFQGSLRAQENVPSEEEGVPPWLT